LPRKAREHSNTNVYHVYLRGVNKQQIFEEWEDYVKFICALYETVIISKYKIYGYCLMGNHVHLLIEVGVEPIEKVMRRIENRYVNWFNRKYDRTGHLFENRYGSVAVSNDQQLLDTLRYILKNPVKGGLSKQVLDYPWSSANAYLCEFESLVSVQLPFTLAGGRDAFWEFINSETDIEERKEKDGDNKSKTKSGQLEKDAKIIALIREMTGFKSPLELQRLDKKSRDVIIRQLRQKRIPIRTLARLTGLSRTLISAVSKGE